MKVVELTTPSNDDGMGNDDTTGQEEEIIMLQQQPSELPVHCLPDRRLLLELVQLCPLVRSQ